MGIPIEHIRVDVEGEMDLRGTLGISQDIQATFNISAPGATPEQLAALKEKTEQYCVVMQTLAQPPAIKTSWLVSQT
jgi:uncharacterized OsmC-like protein